MSPKRRDICHFVCSRGIYYNDSEQRCFYVIVCSSINKIVRNPAIMYTRPEQRADTGNVGDSDINMWQLLL